jgi:acyl-CoA thioesterase FadM
VRYGDIDSSGVSNYGTFANHFQQGFQQNFESLDFKIQTLDFDFETLNFKIQAFKI